MTIRDDDLVDLLHVPYWLARPVLENDHRLEWEATSPVTCAQAFMLTGVDRDQDDPGTACRKELAGVVRAWRAGNMRIATAGLRKLCDLAGVEFDGST